MNGWSMVEGAEVYMTAFRRDGLTWQRLHGAMVQGGEARCTSFSTRSRVHMLPAMVRMRREGRRFRTMWMTLRPPRPE
jgi:hypothetical protein